MTSMKPGATLSALARVRPGTCDRHASASRASFLSTAGPTAASPGGTITGSGWQTRASRTRPSRSLSRAAHEQAESRRTELDEQIRDLLPQWSLAPVVEALMALKGVGLVIAVTLSAEI